MTTALLLHTVRRSMIALTLTAPAVWADSVDCDVLIRTSDITEVVIDGESFQVIRPGAVDESLMQTECVPIQKELDRLTTQLAERDALLNDFEALSTRYQRQLEGYREVQSRALSLNLEYRDLTGKYSEQVTHYEAVSHQLSGVAHDLDDLAGRYRSIAEQMLTRYRLGVALGSGDQGGLARQVHVGIDRVNVYVHDYDNRTSALIGAEIRW